MAVVVTTFLACWLLMASAPDTDVSRLLRKLLIEAPADRLSRITRGDVAVAILLSIAAGMVAFVGETDGVRMLIMGAPDVAVWITTFEVSAYLDILIALAAAASTLRVRGITARLASVVWQRRRSSPRRRDVRARKKPAPPADNDDGRYAAIGLAA